MAALPSGPVLERKCWLYNYAWKMTSEPSRIPRGSPCLPLPVWLGTEDVIAQRPVTPFGKTLRQDQESQVHQRNKWLFSSVMARTGVSHFPCLEFCHCVKVFLIFNMHNLHVVPKAVSALPKYNVLRFWPGLSDYIEKKNRASVWGTGDPEARNSKPVELPHLQFCSKGVWLENSSTTTLCLTSVWSLR